jgi:hypothetical protein
MQFSTLDDLIRALAGEQPELRTIYAENPWTPRSRAIVAEQPEDGSLDPPPGAPGFRYFLEAGTALDVASCYPQNPVEAVIYYAENDAYLPLQD